MINIHQSLQEMLDAKISAEDFAQASEDTHSIVKMIVTSAMKEKIYDLIDIMMHEDRQKYTLDLFETIQTTAWYDFTESNSGRSVFIWQLESVADQEELSEYFEECLCLFDQTYGDCFIDIVQSSEVDLTHRIYTHDDQIQVCKI